MEKQLQIIFFILILSFLPFQSFSQSSITNKQQKLRIHIWSLLEPNPGLEIQQQPDDKFYSYSLREIKRLAPFVFEGMLFGWNFIYTPSDKTRHVQEYFETNSRGSLKSDDVNISYNEPWFENNRLNCYIEYSLSDALSSRIKSFESVIYPKISGKGKGKISKGTQGIQDAFYEALKLAVRDYEQHKIKNKPREISGSVIITNNPRIYINNGFYVVDLDFFLEQDKIVPYSNF